MRLLVPQAGCGRFATLAAKTGRRISRLDNGVDMAYFSPGFPGARPFPAAGPDLVFTGTTDCWPNMDAFCWLVHEVPPRRGRPNLGFWPAPEVAWLAGPPRAQVSGHVPDTRPYIAPAEQAV
jgi:hypothetical protein